MATGSPTESGPSRTAQHISPVSDALHLTGFRWIGRKAEHKSKLCASLNGPHDRPDHEPTPQLDSLRQSRGSSSWHTVAPFHHSSCPNSSCPSCHAATVAYRVHMSYTPPRSILLESRLLTDNTMMNHECVECPSVLTVNVRVWVGAYDDGVRVGHGVRSSWCSSYSEVITPSWCSSCNVQSL